jgi:hypothetical protein
VRSIFADREGNIWVGTSGGLERFRRPKMVKVLLPPVPTWLALVPADSGTIWVGVLGRMLKVGTKVEEVLSHPGAVQCTYRDPDGVVWVASNMGLWRTVAGKFVAVRLPKELVGPSKQAITRDANGGLWLSVARKGVYRLIGGRWINFGGLSGLPREPAIVLTTDNQGRTWFGYTGDRVALLEGDSVRVFTKADGLAVGNVLSIHGRDAHVWIGGERGLARFDGRRFHMVLNQSGLSFRGTSGIVETAEGELWLHGAPGITRIPAAEVSHVGMDPTYEVRGERLDYRDGLEGIAEQLRPIPTAVAGSDGRIWFATSTDLYWIDPRAVPRNPLPPLVTIRDLIAGGRSYRGGRPLVLRERTTGVQIDFAAMGLSLPERIHFRYQLVGSDTGWQDVGGRRQAFYTNLGPGSYRFRVVAANEDGVWNENGAALAFTIPPLLPPVTLVPGIVGVWARRDSVDVVPPTPPAGCRPPPRALRSGVRRAYPHRAGPARYAAAGVYRCVAPGRGGHLESQRTTRGDSGPPRRREAGTADVGGCAAGHLGHPEC